LVHRNAKSALLYTTEARVVITMAGRIAEHKYHGLGNGGFDDDEALDLLGVARRIQAGEEIIDEDSEWSGDCMDIAVTLLEQTPVINDDEYIRALRTYEKKTWLILNKRAVWRAVKKVADALLVAGRLTDAEARAAMAGENIFGKGSVETLREVGIDAELLRNITLALLERSRNEQVQCGVGA
jgi:hypothetical protein